jgi:hypothetical protein
MGSWTYVSNLLGQKTTDNQPLKGCYPCFNSEDRHKDRHLRHNLGTQSIIDLTDKTAARRGSDWSQYSVRLR